MIDIPQIVEAVASVLPARRPIGHHEPSLDVRDLAAINECYYTGLTGYGFINRFEEAIAKACGVRHAIAVSSGTAALHLALMAAGVKPGDEVLVPALTFVATANAVVHAGAVPNFVDGPLNINAYKLRCYLSRETVRAPTGGPRLNRRTGRPVTAMIVVDLLGVPADLAALEAVASEFGLAMIEDAAEALGSRAGNRACGSHGRAGILSFNNNKIVTTGGGGVVLTIKQEKPSNLIPNDPYAPVAATMRPAMEQAVVNMVLRPSAAGPAVPTVPAPPGVAPGEVYPEDVLRLRRGARNAEYEQLR